VRRRGARTEGTLRDLVLLGGGHSHVEVLRRFGTSPPADTRITLVSRLADTPYSGMLPGLIAGHYTRDETHIDLGPLARHAGARFIVDEAIGLDLEARRVRCRAHPPVPYDLLSIDIGSTPVMPASGAAGHAIPVKPIDGFLARWEAMHERIVAAGDRRHVAVVGGGAGGVELMLAVQHRLRRSLVRAGRSISLVEYHLFSRSVAILPSHHARVQRIFSRVLGERAIHVHAGQAVTEVREGSLRSGDGVWHPADEILWTTQAGAAGWLAEAGLAVNDDSFVRVSRHLQSVSHSEVFATGDVAMIDGHPRPRSGVFAVRQGPPLARNLRRALRRAPLIGYTPQRQALSLISTGDRVAVASRGVLAFEGAWVWRWKDWIDRRFMRRYTHLTAVAPGDGE
jgi:selenide, water dikinase